MDRKLDQFPYDENGNVLWELCQRGLTLGAERTVRYAIIFPDPAEALKFGVFLLRQGYWVQVNQIDDRPGYSGEVLVDIVLDVTHKDISEAEEWLAARSATLGGRNDGWQIRGAPPAGDAQIDFIEIEPT